MSTKDGVVCLGGSDCTTALRGRVPVALGGWRSQDIAVAATAETVCQLLRALLGDTIYVAGGIETPASTTALRTFWSLDLGSASPRWRELEPWPGPERMLAVAAVQDGAFFLVSGAALLGGLPGQTGSPLSAGRLSLSAGPRLESRGRSATCGGGCSHARACAGPIHLPRSRRRRRNAREPAAAGSTRPLLCHRDGAVRV